MLTPDRMEEVNQAINIWQQRQKKAHQVAFLLSQWENKEEGSMEENKQDTKALFRFLDYAKISIEELKWCFGEWDLREREKAIINGKIR